jgi:hypothetical protein
MFLFITVQASAQKTIVPEDTTSNCDQILAALQAAATPAAATKLPLSFFGVGIGGETKQEGPDRIADAAVVNKLVTITDDDNTTTGPVLEAHAYIWNIAHDYAVRDGKGRVYVTDKQPCKTADVFPTIATGPFTMLRVGDNEIIKSFGLGWMVGFRLRESESSLNIGVAYTYQQDVKTFAKGFEEGKELPAGEATIRYRNRDGRGLAFVVSFGF